MKFRANHIISVGGSHARRGNPLVLDWTFELELELFLLDSFAKYHEVITNFMSTLATAQLPSSSYRTLFKVSETNCFFDNACSSDENAHAGQYTWNSSKHYSKPVKRFKGTMAGLPIREPLRYRSQYARTSEKSVSEFTVAIARLISNRIPSHISQSKSSDFQSSCFPILTGILLSCRSIRYHIFLLTVYFVLTSYRCWQSTEHYDEELYNGSPHYDIAPANFRL